MITFGLGVLVGVSIVLGTLYFMKTYIKKSK